MIPGEIQDLFSPSGVVMTILTTLVTVSEFFEKFIIKRSEFNDDQRRDHENRGDKNAE
jgi:hypothetical protein